MNKISKFKSRLEAILDFDKYVFKGLYGSQKKTRNKIEIIN